MTDEVGALVLANNYDQTLALSLAQASAPGDLDSHERFIQRLEAAGKLSRRVEGLPTSAEITALRASKLGLTRPELAKLVAYAKIDLFDALVASKAPDDPAFAAPLKAYFPHELAKFEAQMATHRLRREIIATHLANDLVNRCGPSFVDRVRETSRTDAVVIACAFEAGRRIYDLDTLFDRINALDNRAPAAAQIALHQRVASSSRRIVNYLARNAGFDRDQPASILDVVELYREPIADQRARIWDEMSDLRRQRTEARQAGFVELGVPPELAREVALLSPLSTALDVADLARRTGWPVHSAAILHSVIGAEFGVDVLRDAVPQLSLEQHWDRLVVRRAAEDFAETQLRLSEAAAGRAGAPPAEANRDWITAAARDWIASVGQPAQRARSAFGELNAQGPWTFAKLMLISAELNALAAAVR
jgi:glutamate dehydrogenase